MKLKGVKEIVLPVTRP